MLAFLDSAKRAFDRIRGWRSRSNASFFAPAAEQRCRDLASDMRQTRGLDLLLNPGISSFSRRTLQPKKPSDIARPVL